MGKRLRGRGVHYTRWECVLGGEVWAYGDSSVKGGRGVDLAEILHMIFFLLALPKFSPLFCPNLGGQLPPPCPPASYAYGEKTGGK